MYFKRFGFHHCQQLLVSNFILKSTIRLLGSSKKFFEKVTKEKPIEPEAKKAPTKIKKEFKVGKKVQLNLKIIGKSLEIIFGLANEN